MYDFPQYVVEPINYVQWTNILASACMVMPVFTGGVWQDQQFNSASMAVFCAWFCLLIYFQR